MRSPQSLHAKVSSHVDLHDCPKRLNATEPTRAGGNEEWLEAEPLHLPETSLRVMRCMVVEHKVDWSAGVRFDCAVQLWQKAQQALCVGLVLQVDEGASLKTAAAATVNCLAGELAVGDGDLESQGLWLPNWAGGTLGVHPEAHASLININDTLVL